MIGCLSAMIDGVQTKLRTVKDVKDNLDVLLSVSKRLELKLFVPLFLLLYFDN